ncbi:cAMP-binding proteins - catabolite gene activator and regulatory subunit of cAMP-dependent protein kinases [hydrothermal vent metagenome]|uniref:cAMP-binding proteins - catabolite gene activator and regulatory subunit of cAMP-dependent protein kinases n=1 Tax=hydrothermal vent metagenome TaxID=652676 RepID=A0A3B1A744_9ZZZZ
MNLNDYIQHYGERRDYNKGDVLFSQGELCKKLYFIEKGLCKVFYLTPDGQEFIKSFIAENAFITSLRSQMLSEASSFTATCLEPSSVIQLDFQELMSFTTTDLEASNSLNEALFQLAIKKERREYEFLCLSAQERYQLLAKRSPHLVRRVNQADIARYLGITPVALSRIRHRES